MDEFIPRSAAYCLFPAFHLGSGDRSIIHPTPYLRGDAMVQRILRVNRDSVFKLRPLPSDELSNRDTYDVEAGETYEIHSYAYANVNGDFNGHIKFALKDRSLRGFNTWFIHSSNAQIEFDGVVVYPHEDQRSIPILRVVRDTVFKQRPLQSSVLAPSEIISVSREKSFPLHSYAYADNQGDFSNHIKIAIREEKDFLQGRSTWFVYDQHAYVEFDGQVVYPKPEANDFVLRVTRNTFFKRQPEPSSQLSPTQLHSVNQGTVWILHSYAYADRQGDFNRHIKFALKYEKDFINELSTWYIYDGHARVEYNGQVVYPVPRPTPPPPPPNGYSGIRFRLPGSYGHVYTDQPIIPGGDFFWGEATKNATRIPSSVTITENIIGLARTLQRARNQIGRPFQINSWYRPPAVNAAVGGASRSQHLFGKAADIQVAGLSGRQVANAVFGWWNGGIGIYSHMPSVIHLDTGPRRYWGF
ncbi:MAG: D-Ala-D-Ala carboxypeptidase family metallohydrolase [Cyanobacteria bacterium J06638_22]